MLKMKRMISLLLALTMLAGYLPPISAAAEEIAAESAEYAEGFDETETTEAAQETEETVQVTEATAEPAEETTEAAEETNAASEPVEDDGGSSVEVPDTGEEGKGLTDGNIAWDDPEDAFQSLEPEAILQSVTEMAYDVQILDSGSCGSNLKWKLDTNGCLHISGTGSMTGYEIGEGLGGAPSSTAPWAIYAGIITSIQMDRGITEIGECAFALLNGVQAVLIPRSVDKINAYAFQGCFNLGTVVIDYGPDVKDGVLEGASVIGHGAFADCYRLDTITLPESVTRIENFAFGMSGLTSVYFMGDAPEFGDDSGYDTVFFQLDLEAYHPEANDTWTGAVMQKDYGGRIHWYTHLMNQPTRLSELTEVDYLAFSQLAYNDFRNGETVSEFIDRNKLRNKVWGEDGITYGELCANIMRWKACKTKNLSNDNGFYAVAFKNWHEEALIAYRGSLPITGLDVIADEPLDAIFDWLNSDIQMQVFNNVNCLTQENSAFQFYEDVEEICNWSEIHVTGHSLGGGLANIVSARYGCKGITMNAISILDCIYNAMPVEMGETFRGINAWNFVDHANVTDVLAGMYECYLPGNMLKPVVTHSSNVKIDIDLNKLTADEIKYLLKNEFGSLVDCHGLKSFTSRDDAGNIVLNKELGTYIQSDMYYALLDRFWSKVGLGLGREIFMGTTRSEYELAYGTDGEDQTAYGGDGNDTYYLIGSGKDILVGGRGDDTLDGGWGDDDYHYYKGDGCDWIVDIDGDESLHLYNFLPSDVIEVFEPSKNAEDIDIYCNGELIIRIRKDGRTGSIIFDNFDVYVHRTNGVVDEYDIKNFFKNSYYGEKITIQCPVNVEILDAEGNVVYTLADGEESVHYTEYGNFYVFEEEDGSYGKVLDLVEGYTARIVGHDDGTMKIDYWDVTDGELAETPKNFVDVPVSEKFSATFEESEEGELVLAADTDGDNIVDAKIGYDGKIIPTDMVNIDREYVALKTGDTLQLTAKAQPAELTDLIHWSMENNDETVASVNEESGLVTANSAGTAYVIASVTDGETTLTARCRVDVVESEMNEETNTPEIQVDGVQLNTTKVTSELYSTDYAEFDLLLELPQNVSFMSTDDREIPESNSVAIEKAWFTASTAKVAFDLIPLDDRRIAIVPTDYAVDSPEELLKSYKSQVTVVVDGEEYTTEEVLTLTLKQSRPKIKATIPAFNSFYTGQTQTITFTGGTVTSVSDKDIPEWLNLNSDFTLSLNENAGPKNSGKAVLLADIEGWIIPAEVTLSVKNTYKVPTLKLSASSVTLNTLTGDEKTVGITASFADYDTTGLEITHNAGNALIVEKRDTGFAVCTNDNTPAGETYKVTVSDPANDKIKAVTLTVKTVDKDPIMNALKVKGAMDVTFPGNKAIVSVTLKNYADTFEPVLVIRDSDGKDVTEQFRSRWNGAEFEIIPGTAVKGTYTATVSVTIGNSSLEKTGKLTVKQTLPKVKLSAAKVTLNKKLTHSGVIDVFSATKGYELEHGRVYVIAPEEIEAGYDGGKLTVSLKESAAYGKTYKVKIHAYEGAPAATLSVAVPSEQKSNVSVSAKAAGTIDVIREGTAITVTPAFTNAFASDMDSIELTFYKKDGKIWIPVAAGEEPFWYPKDENGNFIITAKEGLVHTDKYSAELIAVIDGTAVPSKPVDLKVKMGSAKLTLSADGNTMFGNDSKDRIGFRITAQDETLKGVKEIVSKDERFEVVPCGNGEFALAFKNETVDRTLPGKTVTVSLNVFLEGNETTETAKPKSNATLKLKVSIVK